MSDVTVLLIAISLAMDAFAVSVSNGICIMDFKIKHKIKMGLYFGGFQFFMPVLGWFLGSRVKSYIEAIDHWIAFILLAFIGGNMIVSAINGKEGENNDLCKTANEVLKPKILLIQAIATSIDALAVGIGFAVLEVNIIKASAIIGIVAFMLSLVGATVGRKLGGLFKNKAEIFGGMILIIIGTHILLEHLL